jgi:hypothetical protein
MILFVVVNRMAAWMEHEYIIMMMMMIMMIMMMIWMIIQMMNTTILTDWNISDPMNHT